MNQSKLGRTEIGFAVSGVIAIVTSFLPWYTISFKGLGELLGEGGSVSANAWKLGMGAWFPMLLMFALGVLAALPAFGVDVKVPGGLPLIGAAAGVLGTVIVLLRWLTLPGGSVGSVGAGYGLYIGLAATIAAAVTGYIGFTKAGGSLSNLGAAFSDKPAVSDAGSDQL